MIKKAVTWVKTNWKTVLKALVLLAVSIALILGTIWIVRRTGVINKVFGNKAVAMASTNTPPATTATTDLKSEVASLKQMLNELRAQMTNAPVAQAEASAPVIPKPAVTNNNTNAVYITTPGLPGIVNNNANTVSVNGAQVSGNGGTRLPHEEPTSVNMWPGQVYNQKINPGRNVFIEKHPGVIEISPSSQKDEWLENREFTLSYTNKTENRVVPVYLRYADKP